MENRITNSLIENEEVSDNINVSGGQETRSTTYELQEWRNISHQSNIQRAGELQQAYLEEQTTEQFSPTVKTLIEKLKEFQKDRRKNSSYYDIDGHLIQLLEKHWNINEIDGDDCILWILIANPQDNPNYSELVNTILKDTEVNVNINNWDPLRIAVNRGDIKTLKALLQRQDLDVMLKDSYGNDIFHTIYSTGVDDYPKWIEKVLVRLQPNKKTIEHLIKQHPSYK